MWDEIRGLRDGGTTVFLTTHYLEEADALCDRLAIIDHGPIVAEGTPTELKRQVAGDVVTLGVDGDVEHVLAAVRAQPFVREASPCEGNWSACTSTTATRPCRSSCASSTARDCAPTTISLAPPEPGRRLPAPDRPLPARRAGGLTDRGVDTAPTTRLTTEGDPP